MSKRIWGNSGTFFDGDDPLTTYEIMGYELKCYLEEKGLIGSKLHVRGAGDIVTLFLPHVTERMIHEVLAKSIATIAVRYDRYIEICPKAKHKGCCIHIIPKKGWRTCTI